jgi:cell division protein FtsL
MAQPMYRDYSKWMFAMEPRLAWVHLTRSQFRLFAAIVMGLLVYFGFILVSRMAVIKNGYAIVELRQERDRLLSEQKRNERQLRELQSLATTEQVARQQMGMVDVNPNQVIYLPESPKPGFSGKAWKALFGG